MWRLFTAGGRDDTNGFVAVDEDAIQPDAVWPNQPAAPELMGWRLLKEMVPLTFCTLTRPVHAGRFFCGLALKVATGLFKHSWSSISFPDIR